MKNSRYPSKLRKKIIVLIFPHFVEREYNTDLDSVDEYNKKKMLLSYFFHIFSYKLLGFFVLAQIIYMWKDHHTHFYEQRIQFFYPRFSKEPSHFKQNCH